MKNLKFKLKNIQQIYILFLLIFITGCSNPSSNNTEISTINNVSSSPVVVIEISQETVLDISEKGSNKYQLIDVRTPEEYKSGHIKTAVNIPHSKLLANPSLFAPYADKHVILYCRSGSRASMVASILEPDLVKNVSHLSGDMQAWQENNLPLVTLE